MRRAFLLAAVVVAAAATVALAQSASPAKPVQTVTLAGERLRADVTGMDGGTVIVSGTVSLSSTSLDSVAGPSCVPSELQRMAVTATPVVVPVLAAGRTEVMLHNVTTNTASLSCRPDPGDGGVPDCATPGYGLTIYPTDTATLRFRNSVTIRCRTCPSGDGTLEHMDVTCTGL